MNTAAHQPALLTEMDAPIRPVEYAPRLNLGVTTRRAAALICAVAVTGGAFADRIANATAATAPTPVLKPLDPALYNVFTTQFKNAAPEPSVSDWDDDLQMDVPEAWWTLKSQHNTTTMPCAVIDSGSTALPALSRDTLPGYSAVTDSTNTSDLIGHGTMISGLIGDQSTATDPDSLTGTADGHCLMENVQVTLPTGNDNLDTAAIAPAIYWAVHHGAKVINMSLQYTAAQQNSAPITAAVNYAIAHDTVVDIAAGNYGNSSLDTDALAFSNPNAIRVAATQPDRQLEILSDSGSAVADIAAPDEMVAQTPSGNLTSIEGTSISTADVSGVVAMVRAEDSGLTPAEVKTILEDTGTKVPALVGQVACGCEVNAEAAVTLASQDAHVARLADHKRPMLKSQKR